MSTGAVMLRVISLRSEKSNNESFESVLRNAGHKVTTLTSTEPAFALVSSSWPDVVIFDPISQFGMSGSIQRLRSNFDGTIVATGHIPDPTISAMLEELGISKFAASSHELLTLLKSVPARPGQRDDVNENSALATDDRQLELVTDDVSPTPELTNQVVSESSVAPDPVKHEHAGRISKQTKRIVRLLAPSIGFSLPFKRFHRAAIASLVIAAVIVAVALPFIRSEANQNQENATAQALPVVPNLLTQPLAPLTIEELSGDHLPLEIAGITDRAVIEQPAVAFWGDTAPDALVTVNGEPVEVSEYGAFVVDYPLDDGANFIEVLASDFSGRTTRQSFTVVSLQ